MKSKKTAKNRHETARNAALRQIAECQPFIEGSLCAFKRKGCEKPGWHLTFKKRGQTQTVYVPMDMVEDVKKWTKEYQKLRRMIRTVTRHSLGIVRGYVANRSAAERAERLRIKKH